MCVEFNRITSQNLGQLKLVHTLSSDHFLGVPRVVVLHMLDCSSKRGDISFLHFIFPLGYLPLGIFLYLWTTNLEFIFSEV